MMSEGFITTAEHQEDEDSDYQAIDLQIIDSRADKTDAVDDAANIIKITSSAVDLYLSFGLTQAKAFVEAMQEIISRYEK